MMAMVMATAMVMGILASIVDGEYGSNGGG